MSEVIQHAQVLHASPDLLGWVIFVVVMMIIIAQHKRILAYVDARIESYTARKESAAVMAELVRNNTAALDNNTALLSIIKRERHELAEKIDYQESMNKERMTHIQTVVNRIDSTARENQRNLVILTDRTKKGE